MSDDSRRFIGITAGNVANGHVYLTDLLRTGYFPPDCFGDSQKSGRRGEMLRLDLDGFREPVLTDIPMDADGVSPRKFFRERSWTAGFFKLHGLGAGDRIEIERLGSHHYKLTPSPGGGDPVPGERSPTGYWLMNTGDGSGEGRAWEDCKRYGFMLAGGTPQHIKMAQKLRVNDKLFAYRSDDGYVGLGVVTAAAVPQWDFVPPGQTSKLIDLPGKAKINRVRMMDPNVCDWCAAVRWVKAVDPGQGVLRSRSFNGTLQHSRQHDLVAELLKHFGPVAGGG